MQDHDEQEYGAPPQVTPTSVDDYLEVMSKSVSLPSKRPSPQSF